MREDEKSAGCGRSKKLRGAGESKKCGVRESPKNAGCGRLKTLRGAGESENCIYLYVFIYSLLALSEEYSTCNVCKCIKLKGSHQEQLGEPGKTNCKILVQRTKGLMSSPNNSVLL